MTSLFFNSYAFLRNFRDKELNTDFCFLQVSFFENQAKGHVKAPYPLHVNEALVAYH